MSAAVRPRRSVLYMPGANERALAKAETLPADALILDLEDPVAPDAKAEARKRVCEAAASPTSRRSAPPAPACRACRWAPPTSLPTGA